MQRALLAAQLTGFTMVARVSVEYLNYAEQPLARHKFVQFTLQDGTLVPAQPTRTQTRTPTACINDSNQKQKMTRMSTVADICSPRGYILLRIGDVGVCHTRVPETQEIIFCDPRAGLDT
jgi:hypothetical protein